MEGRSYEVFLNFNRRDTHVGFIDQLHTRLRDAGVHTFRDEDDVPISEEIGPSVVRAIEQSKISIPVFSKRYAASKWRLKELVQMVECRKRKEQVIMPIFYHVKRSEVQRQTEGYGEALLGHKNMKQVDDETIRKWRAALNEVGGLDGWIIDDMTDRHEGQQVEHVVTTVLHELQNAYLAVSDFLVGMEKNVEEVLGMIGTDTNDVKIIGIHGMGGIGKTTLAKIVCKKLSPNFYSHCFLANVRETSRLKGIVWLQNQLFSYLLKQAHSNVIHCIDDGIRMIEERFSREKVILLDDVDKKNQLIALLGRPSCFGPGSRILITTRNANVLREFGVKLTYLVDGLDPDISLQLCSKHVFKRDYPPTNKMEKSIEFVNMAKGLPLILEFMGSTLSTCGQKEEIWDDYLVKWKKDGIKEIRNTLMMSDDALNSSQRQIFLDIACYFNGCDKRTAMYMWKDSGSFPEVELEVLQSMSLIKIEEDNKLWMHDLLKDHGRKIVSQESGGKLGKRSGLWNHEDVLKTLLQKKVEFSKPANTEHSSFKGVEGKYEGNESGIDNIRSNDDQLKELNSHLDGGIKWRKIDEKFFISNKEIGKGSNGTIVYEGSHDGRRAAVKCLVKGHRDVARVEYQNLISSDQHENIVRYYGMKEDPNFVYLALEHCICSLDDLIQAKSDSSDNSVFPDDSPTMKAYKLKLGSVRGEMQDVNLWSADGYPSCQLLKLMSDVVSGLSHLHNLRMIHRDIKPQNVLITKNPSFGAKLSDMGISKYLSKDKSSLGNHATVCGTIGWRAPEQLSLDGRQTQKVDMFSLGCVLFFCVTRGKHPFGKTTEREYKIDHNIKDLSCVEFIPEAHDLILHLLDQDPKLRLKASEVLHHPFFWSSYMRLKFLHDVSDKVEVEAKKARSVPLKASGAVTHKVESEAEAGKDNSDLPKKLEDIAHSVFGEDWTNLMDKDVMKDLNLNRHTSYEGSSIRHLLRAVRNKFNHLMDAPEKVKAILGSNPNGLDAYFTKRFPRLLIESYKVVSQSPEKKELLAGVLSMLPK